MSNGSYHPCSHAPATHSSSSTTTSRRLLLTPGEKRFCKGIINLGHKRGSRRRCKDSPSIIKSLLLRIREAGIRRSNLFKSAKGEVHLRGAAHIISHHRRHRSSEAEWGSYLASAALFPGFLSGCHFIAALRYLRRTMWPRSRCG